MTSTGATRTRPLQKIQHPALGGTTAGGSGPLSPGLVTPIARELPMRANHVGAIVAIRALAEQQSEEDR